MLRANLRTTCAHCRRERPRNGQRKGATVVEMAIVLPVFFTFMIGLFEFSHVLMVNNMLTSIAKQAAHRGSFEDTSSADVQAFAAPKLNAVSSSGLATMVIKDASVYENGGTHDASSLPNIELSSAESRQLFLVQVEVPYDSIALLPPFWVKNKTLRGISIMRRE